jgi:hypothetical protein
MKWSSSKVNDVTTGRIVQYKDDDGTDWPAIITKVSKDTGEISLTVNKEDGFAFVKASIRPLKYRTAIPGAWWWPVQRGKIKPRKETDNAGTASSQEN